MSRLRVGVIGCGLIAQVMHLPYLRELSDEFEIAALCDVAPDVLAACARDYHVARRFTDWRALLREKLDAVLILTSGSHAPIALAAAEQGLHMLVEKPMCFSVAEGREMIAAAERAGVVLMVGYNKRYDPAYLRMCEEAQGVRDARLLRVTTLESPLQPYVAHYPMHRSGPLPSDVVERFAADNAARITAAIGEADVLSRHAYHLVLLDSMVHELNAVRGLLGEPDVLDFADIGEHGLNLALRFGELRCVIAWVDLPGIARYSMEFALYAPERRLTLSFPSPFLRSAPTLLAIEDGEAGGARSRRSEEIASYEESFKQELRHFHACVTEGRAPVTSARDALGDIALCEAVVAAHRAHTARPHPTRV